MLTGYPACASRPNVLCKFSRRRRREEDGLRILQRYLLREMTVDFLGVTVVATAVMLVNTVGEVLARASALGTDMPPLAHADVA